MSSVISMAIQGEESNAGNKRGLCCGAMLVALACTISIFLISNSVGAQQEVDALAGKTADIAADSIGPIAVAGCEATAGETASITVADAADDDATDVVFTDDADTAFRFGQQGVTITAEGGGDLKVANENDPGTGEVVSSEGITCGDGGRQRVNDDDTTTDDTRTADDLEGLSCDQLLVLFRADSSSGQQYRTGSSSGRQYGAAAVFADSYVRAQVEVCLEEEIIEGTAADGELPDTGGLSLLALAVLGFVSAAAGLSVIRGGQR
jgi:hypothetical protein